jgi:hypothetical protein
MLERHKLLEAYRTNKRPPTELMGSYNDEDTEFWTYMLQYWHQAPIDDLELWNPGQIQYQNSNGTIQIPNSMAE